MPSLPRLWVVPFQGLAGIHRLGALGAAWSTWSRNGFHRTWTVRGEADSWVHGAARKCLLITCKIIIPPHDRGTHRTGHRIARKNVSPDYWDPPATSSHARKCVRAKKTFPPDWWDPPATSSHARKCLTVGTHLVEAYVALSFWSRTCTYILVDVKARTCHIRRAYVS